jgi:hypothetical protein
MKRALFALVYLALIMTGCAVSSSQSSDKKTLKNEERAAAVEQVVAVIESGNYTFTVQSISPTGGRTIQSTTPYTMKAVNGNYEASLPYFGRAYQASYGGDGGIEFNGTPEDLKIIRDTKKNTVTVTFSMNQSNEKYTITFMVGSTWYGTLIVSSQNRQTISYYGLVSEPAG